jgi:4-amino-4-deoxy-L-arabinose transferase and related glycosyltransferases of PMT family
MNPSKMILFLFLTIMSYLVMMNVLISRGFQSIGGTASISFNLITVLAASLLILLLISGREKITRAAEKWAARPVTVPVLLAIGLVIQLGVVLLFRVFPSWDFGTVVRNATLLATGKPISSYFIYYPNNMLIVILLALIGKITVPSLAAYLIFSILATAASDYLIYQIAVRLCGKTAGLFCLTASVAFIPYFLDAPIVYTDTLSLPFLLVPLYLMIRRDGTFRESFIAVTAASVILALGVLLKGLLIIFVIAFSLTLLIILSNRKKLYFVLPFLCLFLVSFLFNESIFISGVLHQEQVQRFSFPVTHWLLMGQNQTHYGKYLKSDVDSTLRLLQTHPHAQVTGIEWRQLGRRVSEKGWSGNLRFLNEKMAETWTDGTFYTLNKLKRKPVHPRMIRQLTSHPWDWIFQGYARIYLLLLMTGVLLSGFRIRHRHINPGPFLIFSMLSVIGFFLFLILWETRSRYLVSLSPLLILLAVTSYTGIGKKTAEPLEKADSAAH